MAPLLLLHGFSQTVDCFDPFVDALASLGLPSVAVPLSGHDVGPGAPPLVTSDLWGEADRLAQRHQASGHRIWLGYSMGARLALHVALAHPEVVGALVLISGTAGIDDPTLRSCRRRDDESLATRIEEIGVNAFLEEWLDQPLFARLPEDPDRITRRSTNTAAGLASSLRHWGTGTMDPPLWNRLGSIGVPVLVVAGSDDAKFVDLGMRIADETGPDATFVTIPGGGHAVHLEQPHAVAETIRSWMSAGRCPGSDPLDLQPG